MDSVIRIKSNPDYNTILEQEIVTTFNIEHNTWFVADLTKLEERIDRCMFYEFLNMYFIPSSVCLFIKSTSSIGVNEGEFFSGLFQLPSERFSFIYFTDNNAYQHISSTCPYPEILSYGNILSSYEPDEVLL